MRNLCKHEKQFVKLLVDIPDSFWLGKIRWSWCKNCGATRMDVIRSKQLKIGNWKSPKIARSELWLLI